MRIAVLSELFPPSIGGGEMRYYEIYRRLAKRHDVHVYTMAIEGEPREETLDGIHVHRLGIDHPLRGRRYSPLFFYFASLVPRLLRERFDVIDANAYVSALGGWIAGKLKRKPCCVTIHDVYGGKWGEYLGKGFGPLGRLIEVALLSLPFKKVVTVSEAVKGALGKENVVVIPNGVDLKLFGKMKSVRDEDRYIYVGRLVKLKNLTDLIRAFKIVSEKNRKAKLELVGDGPREGELRKMAKDAGIQDKIIFSGFLGDHRKLAERIKGSGCLVNPSLREGFGIVLLEAMAAGTPVVAYDNESYGKFARHGENCLLAPRKDYRKLADCMMLARDAKVRQKLTGNGIKTARKFSWDSTAKEVEKVLVS